MNSTDNYDIALLGHYTKETIVSAAGTRLVDGGAFNYGAHVAARMGLKVAAVTRLAREDFHVVDELTRLGVAVLRAPPPTPPACALSIPPPTWTNGLFTSPARRETSRQPKVADLQARAILVGASMRGEVGLEVFRR